MQALVRGDARERLKIVDGTDIDRARRAISRKGSIPAARSASITGRSTSIRMRWSTSTGIRRS